MRPEIYLDNAATTRPDPAVVQAMVRVLEEDFGNPSSLHTKGISAERQVAAARAQVAALLGVDPGRVFFTSGGTEANNLCVRGAVRSYARRGRHVISTALEHSSVLSPIRTLEREGFDVTILPVNRDGVVDPQAVSAALRPDTILVSVMAVNNEVGSVQPIAEIARVLRSAHAERARKENRLPFLHVDGVQAFGRIPIPAGDVDLLSVSAHKVHGPKGVGAAVIRSGIQLEPMQSGGDQERGVRPGTENVPGIVGFGAAAARLAEVGTAGTEHTSSLRRRLIDRLLSTPGIALNGPAADSGAPHILNIRVDGVRGETLVHRLELDGIYVSTGSACHSRDPQPSHVLLALGLSREEAFSSVRLSLARTNTKEEVDAAADAIARAVAELRALTASPHGGRQARLGTSTRS